MKAFRIYLDLDGVLADFDRGERELCPPGLRPKWDGIRTVPHFYRRLQLMPGARQLFDAVYAAYGDRCEILTGIPKARHGIEHAAEDKVAWVREMLSPTVTVHTVYKEEKAGFVTGPECILIDDFPSNVAEWQQQGGTGILYESAGQVLQQLKQYGVGI